MQLTKVTNKYLIMAFASGHIVYRRIFKLCMNYESSGILGFRPITTELLWSIVSWVVVHLGVNIPWQQILTYAYFTAVHLHVLPCVCMYAQQGYIASWAPWQLPTTWHMAQVWVAKTLALPLQPTRSWPDKAWWYPWIVHELYRSFDSWSSFDRTALILL